MHTKYTIYVIFSCILSNHLSMLKALERRRHREKKHLTCHFRNISRPNVLSTQVQLDGKSLFQIKLLRAAN